MELVSSSDFWTIVAIVVSALGMQRAMKADARKELHIFRTEMDERFKEAERREKARERRLAEQISGMKQELAEQISDMKHELGHRIGGVKQEFGHRTSSIKQELGHRIDRMEDRMNENHRDVSTGLAETKAAVSALSAKLDERSSPRRLEGGGRPSATGSVASGVSVRKPSGSYSGDEPRGEGEPEAPEDGRRGIEYGHPDQA